LKICPALQDTALGRWCNSACWSSPACDRLFVGVVM